MGLPNEQPRKAHRQGQTETQTQGPRSRRCKHSVRCTPLFQVRTRVPHVDRNQRRLPRTANARHLISFFLSFPMSSAFVNSSPILQANNHNSYLISIQHSSSGVEPQQRISCQKVHSVNKSAPHQEVGRVLIVIVSQPSCNPVPKFLKKKIKIVFDLKKIPKTKMTL